MTSKILITLFLISVSQTVLGQELRVSGRDIIGANGRKVFLNGINQAWIEYGRDFGNDNSGRVWARQMRMLDRLRDAGGNAMRYWLFVEGTNIPNFNGDGYVVGTDGQNNLIRDVRNYVREAHRRGIYVIFCLWNAAVMNNQKEKDLFWDDSKLQSFIDKALVPLVNAIKDEPGVGAWEILNEPEAAVQISGDSNPCFDTNKLRGSGAGWSGAQLPIRNILKFINWQADAIKRADPSSLITVGSWSEKASTDNFGYYNFYKDSCLRAAGGRNSGILSFYQIHSYSHGGSFGERAPFKVNANSYGLDKPVVIGELSEDLGGGGMSSQQLYEYGYNNGYSGAWGWADQDAESQFAKAFAGVKHLSDKIRNSGNPPPSNPPSNPPSSNCDDNPPDNRYSCEQQKNWGKCGESWMANFCRRTCGRCTVSCPDTPPDNRYTCEQQKGWGQCGQSWMQGYCKRSCGTCGSRAMADTNTILENQNKSQSDFSLSTSSIVIIVVGVIIGVGMIVINVIFTLFNSPRTVESV